MFRNNNNKLNNSYLIDAVPTLKFFEYQLEYYRVYKNEHKKIHGLYSYIEFKLNYGRKPDSITEIIKALKRLVHETGNPLALIVLAKAYYLRQRRNHPSQRAAIGVGVFALTISVVGIRFAEGLLEVSTNPDAKRAFYCLILAKMLAEQSEIKDLVMQRLNQMTDYYFENSAVSDSKPFYEKILNDNDALKDFVTKNKSFENFRTKHLSSKTRVAFDGIIQALAKDAQASPAHKLA